MTLRRLMDDSSENTGHFMGLCYQSHCATSLNVPCGQGLELRVTTFGKWDSNSAMWLKPISTTEWLKLHHFWTYSCQTTWNISSRCIVRCSRILNNIIKGKRVCKMTFEKKIRILWVCQCIIRVLKPILWL